MSLARSYSKNDNIAHRLAISSPAVACRPGVVVILHLAAVVLSGCNSSSPAPDDLSAGLDPAKPKYASPWDKPILGKGPSAGDGSAARTGRYDELLRSSSGDAPLRSLATASPFQVGDDLPVAPERDGSFALTQDDEAQRDRVKALAQGIDVSKDAKSALAVGGQKGWSIVLFTFSRETDAAKASETLAQVRSSGLPEARLEERGPALVIAYGEYPSADSRAAKADLERVKAILINGGTPFIGAVLSPPPYEALPGTIPEYDLRNVPMRFGKDALYTLQVGVYCRVDDQEPTAKELGEFREAAERAVVELRRQGETAFYYHGPRRSSVTVGVFFEKDYNVRDPRTQSPVLVALRAKYPYNLANGAGLQRTQRGSERAVMDPSFIVNIPR
jgi:hypothetical protein